MTLFSYETDGAKLRAELSFAKEEGYTHCALIRVRLGTLERIASIVYTRSKRLAAALEPHGLRFVGDIWTREQLLVLFYSKGRPDEAILDETIGKNKAVDTDILKDTEMAEYLRIYPSVAQRQVVESRARIELLRRRGDNASRPRKLNHYLYFADPFLRMRFAQKAREGGYCIGTEFEAPERTLPHGVSMISVSSLQSKALHDAIDGVAKIAACFGGEYDDWDCPIVK